MSMFKNAMAAGMNVGVVLTVAQFSLVITAVMFFVVYGQKLTVYDGLGGLCIVVGAVLISLGGSSTVGEGEVNDRGYYMALAYLFAFSLSCAFTFSQFTHQWVLKTGCISE